MAFSSLRLHTIRVVVSADARTAGDAMRLAHDGGVEGGFLTPSPSGLRFSPTFLNRGTRFVVAYADDEPIASVTLVEDGPFGLPSDRAFVEEIDAYRSEGGHLFEAGAWVIGRDWRRHTAYVGAFLFGAALRLALAAGGERRMVATVEPNRIGLVTGLFGYDAVVGPRPYMTLPGTFIATQTSSTWAAHFADPSGPVTRRIVGERMFEPDPDWLEYDLDGPHWTESYLDDLLIETGVGDRLQSQLDLLAGYRSRSATEVLR